MNRRAMWRCAGGPKNVALVIGAFLVAGGVGGCRDSRETADASAPDLAVDGAPADRAPPADGPRADLRPAHDVFVGPLSGITIDDYPLVDGSTSTLPLARVIACELLGLSYGWQPGLGSEGEAEIVPLASTPEQEVLAGKIMQRIVHNKTHQAYLNLVDGAADLIMVANPPSPEERAYAEQRGVELTWEPLALDALVIVVNAANPVTGLTTAQIQGIFKGQISDWGAVGGQPGAIHPYVRPENSGSQQLMNTIVMQGAPMAPWPPDRTPSFMGALIDAIRSDPLAIGYSVYYWVTYQYATTGYAVIAVDGVTPTPQTIGARSYPFAAEVWIVTRADLPPQSLAHQLHDWLLGPDGQVVVGRSGYVPVGAP